MIESFEEQIAKKTEEELKEIVINDEKYQFEFVSLAEKELLNREIPIDSVLESRKLKYENIIASLEKGKKANFLLVLFSYFGVSAFNYGKFGSGMFFMFLAYSWAFSKKKFKGESYFVYDEKSRQDGKNLLFIGSISLITSFYYLFILKK